MMLSSSASRNASRVVARHYTRSSAVKLAEPKMHNATGIWDALKAKRPIDADDLHTVFHPPYKASNVFLMVGSMAVIGFGTMWYGVVHQQYKQGFWK